MTIPGALAVHLGAALTYELVKPVPPPRLFLHFDGTGTGVVQSRPAGLSCSDNCNVSFAPGTELELLASPGENSTFAGWTKGCTMREDYVLSCTLTLEQDTHVHVDFGEIPKEVEVAWIKVDQPATQPNELTVTLPDPAIEAEMLVEPLAEVAPEVVPETAPEPPPEEVPPPPPPTPAPAQPPPEMANLRSVEVPDQNEVEKAPDDATHLSDKNRDVAEETRALDTNLEREQAGKTAASAESDIQSEDIGAQEEELAQLEDSEPTTLEDQRLEESTHNGESDKAVGVRAGEDGDNGEDGERGDDTPVPERGALAMRGIEGRGSLLTDDEQSGGKQGDPGRAGRPGIKTQLAFEDYERIVGKDAADKEVALARRKLSKRRGRFEQKMDAVKSALENYTPEVKTGNQTALKTRAAPFAVYLARMHRGIHTLWAEGFLDDLNDKSAGHPLNNWQLYTKIEIVINPDGTVHKTNIVTHSGRLEFDVAAIDVILSAAPYEPPPEVIRSPDGRAYMHWGFYRDHRQCGTFNAQPFILSEAPAGSDNAMDDGDLVRSIPRRARQGEQAGSTANGQETAEAGAAGARSAGDALSPEDQQAVHTANLWLTGYRHNDVARMVQVSGAPFSSGTAVVASSAAEITSLYRAVLQETGGRLREWKLMSPAGYRQHFGALPPGIDAGKPQLLLVVRTGREHFTLVLDRQANGEYKIIGLHR